MFLKSNCYRFKPRHQDLLCIILSTSAGEKDYEDLVEFVHASISS
jgi:hypothetical protein